LIVFPNPTRDIVNINFYSKNEEDVTIHFFDLAGREVLLRTFHAASGENNFETSVSHFPSGIYIILFKSEEGISRKQIVVD
jgi:hypothetical protein